MSSTRLAPSTTCTSTLNPLFGPLTSRPSRILLACTHYPLLYGGIRAIVPDDVEVLAQGELVAERLADWLVRHPDMDQRLTKHGRREFTTTDDPLWFAEQGARILSHAITARRVRLNEVRS